MDLTTIPDNSDEEILLAKEETAYRVYRTLWKDFYDWEEQYCLQALQGLEQPLAYPEFPSGISVESDSFDSLNEYTEWFTIESYDDHYEIALPLRLKFQEEGFPPYSSYSACTPSSTNAQYPKSLMEKVPFTPFSDDPKFKRMRYLSLFNNFGWQTEFWDPDREIIFLETTRRLHHSHGFSDLEIDNLQIHYVPIRVHGSAGMIWEVSQRDRLLWPGSQMSMLPDLVQQQPNLNLQESVNQGIVSFCDNLNCLRSACLAHDESHPIFTVKPTMTSKVLRSIHVTPCNLDCFKLHLAADAELDLSNLGEPWHEKDLSLFSSVIKFAPDSHPCNLAVICRRPCIEVYIQRCKYFSDDDIEAERTEISPTQPLDMKFDEDDLVHMPDMALEDSVITQGLATNTPALASIIVNDARGRADARGPVISDIRDVNAMGQDCVQRRLTVPVGWRVVSVIPRFASLAMLGGRALTCRNTMLQRGVFPRIWVHSSRFGLGAFAMNRIDTGRCVGDYIGEFIGEDAFAVSRIRRFLHRNYAFALTRTLSLDSYSLGNETRYLNHSNRSNCYARLTMVNGDLKIGIYAGTTIKKAAELLLDYGETYWNEPESDEGDID